MYVSLHLNALINQSTIQILGSQILWYEIAIVLLISISCTAQSAIALPLSTLSQKNTITYWDNMSSTLLELIRTKHETAEVFERQIGAILDEKPNGVRTNIRMFIFQ